MNYGGNMGVIDAIKDQFIDLIEYEDRDNKTIVKKYVRPGDNNEIKTGAKLIVRPSQAAVFYTKGQFADILEEGSHILRTENLPILSKILALPYLFNSPLKSDVYFINLRQFIGNKWETKNPLILRDKEFKVIRIKALGTFAFKINDVEKFVREVLGTQRKFETNDILEYLGSYILEAFSTVVGEINIPIIDLAMQYSKLSSLVQLKSNIKAREIGIEFSNVNIENISLPENVEKLIDEQSGIGMASQDMDEFIRYQSARAIRDAAGSSNGIAGLGASLAIGNQIAQTMTNNISEKSENGKVKIRCQNCGALNDEEVKYCSECGGNLANNDKKIAAKEEEKSSNAVYDKLREYKKLLDEGVLTSEEYEAIKDKLLKN